MHAYLVIGTDEKKVNRLKEKILKKESAKKVEFELQKIAHVRDLSSFTNLKINERTAIVIDNIDSATTEALNAFLKNLEEPQKDLIYVLTAQTSNGVLPTIISRCVVITTGKKEMDKKANSYVKRFLSLSPEKQLVFIKDIRGREESIKFLEDIIYSSSYLLKGEKSEHLKLAKILKNATFARERIKANANPTLQLTNFVLQVV